MAASSGASRGLGRGLSALIPRDALDEASARVVTDVAIERIEMNPDQPRTVMDGEALAALTQSVKDHGIIQPLLVTELREPDGSTRFRLIAGERRLRAAKAAGLLRVPVTVRETSSREQLELALIENLQREDLGPLEEAEAYRRLVDEFGLTQLQVAERMGRSRATVTNRLRLLELAARATGRARGGADQRGARTGLAGDRRARGAAGGAAARRARGAERAPDGAAGAGAEAVRPAAALACAGSGAGRAGGGVASQPGDEGWAAEDQARQRDADDPVL